MYRLLRALAITEPVSREVARASSQVQVPFASRNYVTASVKEEIQQKKFTKQRIEAPSEKQYTRYDALPQDPKQAARLHAFDLFLATAEENDVKLERLEQQIFRLPVEDQTQFSGIDRRFGQFDEEFLLDPHVHTALQQLMNTLPLTNLQNKNSFAVGIHAFKLHIDPTDPDLHEADPTTEGVHRDGAEMVMINYAGARNVAKTSALTYLWTNDQPSGQPDLTDPEQLKNLITVMRLNEAGEYMILSDRFFKHHVTKLLQIDEDKPAERKIMVLYIRDFKESDNIVLDSVNPLDFSFHVLHNE